VLAEGQGIALETGVGQDRVVALPRSIPVASIHLLQRALAQHDGVLIQADAQPELPRLAAVLVKEPGQADAHLAGAVAGSPLAFGHD
jgi:hypothetical protein